MASYERKESSSYRSEVFVPIYRDSRSFEQHEMDSFKDMQERMTRRHAEGKRFNMSLKTGVFDEDRMFSEALARMEERRRKWDMEISQKRADFFQLKPSSGLLLDGNNRDFGSGCRSIVTRDSVLESNFERGEDGSVMYKLSFDVKSFSPEDIKVTTENGRLDVKAMKTVTTANSTSSSEFSRSITIPENVNPQDLSCTLSSDGILTLKAPVNTPTYEESVSGSSVKSDISSRATPMGNTLSTMKDNTIKNFSSTTSSYSSSKKSTSTIKDGVTTATSGSSEFYSSSQQSNDKNDFVLQSDRRKFDNSSQQQRIGHLDNTFQNLSIFDNKPLGSGDSQFHKGFKNIVKTQDGKQELNIEVEIGQDYLPEDLNIRTENDRLYIYAKHEEKTANRSSFREFSKEYDIPRHVIPEMIKAKLENGILTIAAPMSDLAIEH